MRTVHTYTPSTQQQQQQTSTSLSHSIGQQTQQQHSPISGFSSVRQCLLRMHSQLQSASNQQIPMDLSHTHAHLSKMATRSMTSTTGTLRSQPILTSSATTPTRTFYGNIAPSSTSSATNEQIAKILTVPASGLLSKSHTTTSNLRPASPKLAYARSNIDESLQCALCIDRLRDPRALPCQHVFCCTCLNSIHSFAPPNGATIACPLCRRIFPFVGADKFPVSYIHRTLLELTPTNYTVHAKCGKCQEKQPLVLCTCCDYLLCQICAENDRQKILDNIEHIVQTCHYRLKRIHHTRDQLYANCQANMTTIKQIETAYDNLERKLSEQKRSVLNRLHRHSEQITETFWSKLQIPCENTTEPMIELLRQADNLLKKNHQTKFDDILSLFYNLSSIAEQLEQANSLIDTCDVQKLLKNDIQISGSGLAQIRIHLTKFDGQNQDETLSLLPPSLLPPCVLPVVSTRQRPRKTEPKRLIQQIEDDDDDETEVETAILKRMKMEYNAETLVNLDDSNPSNEHEQLFEGIDDGDDEDDDDIVYLETIQKSAPSLSAVDELLQIVDSN